MEKKKKILFVIVVLILIVIILGICYMISKKDENNKEINNKEVENKISENVVNEVENAIDNEIENIVEEEKLEIGVTNSEKMELEEKAKELMSKYVSLSYYEADTLGAMPYILVELELIDSEDLDKILQDASVATRDYIKTTVKYNDFKSAMLEYISEEYFNKYFKLYKNMDGFVGIQNTAAGFGAAEVESAELLNIENDEYHFKIVFKDVQTYELYASGYSYVKENDWLFYDEVTLKYENNKLVISKYSDYTPYIEGIYVYEASDVGYEFWADGKVEYSTNMTTDTGTYKAVAKDTFEIVFTDRISYEEDYDNKYTDENGYEIIPFKRVECKIERKEKVVIENEEKLTIEYDVDGEIYKGELVKFDIDE